MGQGRRGKDPDLARPNQLDRAELDLLIQPGRAKYGLEFKFTDTPATTKSMRMALADLDFKRLFVVHPGARRFDLDENIIALPLTSLPEESPRW